MKNEDARKGDMTEEEVRNMINESFEGFPEYMMMKLHATEVEDEKRIEERINVFKYHMLNNMIKKNKCMYIIIKRNKTNNIK